MKISLSGTVFALTALTSTATAFLDGCRCRGDYNGLPFWKGHIDAFINSYQASGPNEWTIRPINLSTRTFPESPVVVRILTSNEAVTLTKQAAIDLFWELKAKRSALGCDNKGEGIECSKASRGTPQFSINLLNKNTYAQPVPSPTRFVVAS